MPAARSVVYFAYLGDEGTEADVVDQRMAYMAQQLAWLSALVAAAERPIDVLVPYVAPRSRDAAVHEAVVRHGFRIDPASVADERINRFEYVGFRALKALAEHAHPDHLLYYCHSKGIVQLARSKMGLFRLHSEVGLTADLTRLETDPALSRAGLFPSRFGWCWYNFFWIKAGLMARLPVAEAEDRYLFEALIGGPRDKEGYRGVLPLIDRLPFAETGIAPQPWYRPEETSSPILDATYTRYGAMTTPARDGRGRLLPV